MQNSVVRLADRRRILTESSFFSQQVRSAEGITLAQFVRSLILLLTFAVLAFVLFGRDLKIIGLTTAIGCLLMVLNKAWRLTSSMTFGTPDT